jgi:hypothetical protein
MTKTKRKNQDRKPKYQQTEETLNQEKANGLAKNILLLVEGETEEIYFNKLKQNSLLNGSLAGIVVEIVGNLGNAKEIAKAKQEDYTQIWIVADNDKRNAFVLEEKGIPFFNNLSKGQLPEDIKNKLQEAYNSDEHNYFLSIYDYLQWLKMAIGVDEAIEFWDTIQHFTTKKNREFRDFDKEFIQTKNNKIHLAYSCIAFEFWLILHFENNNKAFLWVDKGKDENVDVFTYFKTICEDYEKGKAKEDEKKKQKCTAYSCLFKDWKKEHQTIQDEWDVLFRVITAYKNVSWLQNTMLPTLKRQSDKWYEVNPYVLGMDTLTAELLNIKQLNQEIDYFGLTLQFGFDNHNNQLSIQIATDEAFQITNSQRDCFEIKSNGGISFLPIIQNDFQFPNEYKPVKLQYNISDAENADLVLIFKDPRLHSKSSQLFILLN